MATIRQLKLLSALVETGSVTTAAEQVGITQPAASKSLASLQRHAGFQIYTKRNNRILLTQKGLSLLDEANRLVRMADDFDGIVADIRERGAQRIRIATTQSIFSSSAFANGLKDFSDQFPNVRFEIESTTRQDLIRLVETDRTDLALAYGPITTTNVTAEVFGTSQLCAIARKGGVLKDLETVAATDLAVVPIVLFFARSRHRKMIDQFFEQAGHVPQIFAEVANASATLSIARTGAAVGICDAHYVQELSDDDLDIRECVGNMSLDVAFVQRKNSEPSSYIQSLKQFLATNWNERAGSETEMPVTL